MRHANPRDIVPDDTAPPAEVIAIRPGRPLEGTVIVDGSKNAALPLLSAAAVVGAPVRVTNIPDSTDVHTLLGLLLGAGFDVVHVPGEAGSMVITPSRRHRVEAELLTAASTIRASYYLVPTLLGRFGRARLPWPGGCRIGDRGMEQHFRVYEAFGDRCSTHRYGYEIQRSRAKQGTVSVALPFRSRGATIVAILRAVVSRQELRLSTPNLSPETLGVVEALGSIGWMRAVERDLLVLTPPTETPAVHDLTWTVPGDKIEAGTLACAVAATRGTARIEGVCAGDFTPALEHLRRTGVVITEHVNGIEIDARHIARGELPIHASASLSPSGLDADFEPSLLAFALGIPGRHAFADTINPGRHANLIPQLRCMGAEIEEVSPTQCRFAGPQRLTGAGVETTDIRTGAALLIAGLTARGITTLGGLEQLRRGHADLPGKLRALGADICEVTP
ncbi:UDP-N-acetylglucosamine 1-carboxyvinyltransferase [Streptomyces sp. NPDC008317]|uniref:UDP-N-acetylglucosamine 1-carboxyvinyltransferase n=1 Tax=Streptomyces sp. NPDC008317 TaxID=3364827 RepID=UPI0036EA566A